MDSSHAKAALLHTIRESYLLKNLPEDSLLELAQEISQVVLDKDEALFNLGDPSDSIYFLASGQLDVVGQDKKGSQIVYATLEAGSVVGEMGYFTGQHRTATIISKVSSTLVKVPDSGMRRLIDNYPDAMERVGDVIRHRLEENELYKILPKLLGNLDAKTFRDIYERVVWVHLDRGEYLMKQGDPPDSMFILVRGRLRATVITEDGSQITVGEITPGESIGEMAMFTHENRTASVDAVRGSSLVRFSRDDFDWITKTYPRIVQEITKVIIGRLRRLSNSKQKSVEITNIAIGPINPDVPILDFADRLVKSLKRIDTATVLSSQQVDNTLGIDKISQAGLGSPLDLKIATWLDDIETSNRFVVYVTDNTFSEWTLRSLHQADRILLVGQAGDPPAKSSFEAEIAKSSTARQDLVLLHPDDTRPPTGTIRWLEARKVARHYHICWNNDDNFHRLSRFLAGKAVGLCLGGGGARGFAHFGVLRTMLEQGIPIDIIGGNSMGAYVASVYAVGKAQGWSVDQMIQGVKKIFSRWYYEIGPLNPPISSLVGDGMFVSDIKDVLGKTTIEDLWTPYFCVSSNLTRASVKVHDTGPLWRAVRVSGGLPGILPPLVLDNDLHVDGALLNNLPVDVMSQKCDGGVVMAIDVSPLVDMSVNVQPRDTLSGWDILLSRAKLTPEEIKMPGLLTIMSRSSEIGTILQLHGKLDKLTDYHVTMPVERFDILGFGDADEIVQAGYRESQSSLLNWIESSEHLEYWRNPEEA
jgi:lysophospholipid hydrolase